MSSKGAVLLPFSHQLGVRNRRFKAYLNKCRTALQYSQIWQLYLGYVDIRVVRGLCCLEWKFVEMLKKALDTGNISMSVTKTRKWAWYTSLLLANFAASLRPRQDAGMLLAARLFCVFRALMDFSWSLRIFLSFC